MSIKDDSAARTYFEKSTMTLKAHDFMIFFCTSTLATVELKWQNKRPNQAKEYYIFFLSNVKLQITKISSDFLSNLKNLWI